MKQWMSAALFAAMLAPAAVAQQMAMDCPMMKQQQSAAMKDMDSKLQTLVDEMNKADGQAKIDKMAAVINELVAEHAAMHSQMQMPAMDPKNCPMMKKSAKKSASMQPKSCH